jgi:hypothetical protein
VLLLPVLKLIGLKLIGLKLIGLLREFKGGLGVFIHDVEVPSWETGRVESFHVKRTFRIRQLALGI